MRRGERASLALSALYFFALMTSYGLLKPVREAMGLTGGAEKLPLLFTGTMVATLLVNPLFARLVARTPRRRFLPTVYATSMACLLALWLAFRLVPREDEIVVAYAFFVFVSVFNLFVVSVFWGFMADVWRLEEAKRLYGLLGAAGTAGMIVGPLLATWLPSRIGAVNLILVTVGLLAIVIACLWALLARHRGAGTAADDARADVLRGGDAWRGFRLVAERPYLRWIAAYVLLHGWVGTYLYFQQQHLVEGAFATREARTEFWGALNVWEQSVTVVVQLVFTAWLLRRFGLTFALVSQPVLAVLGWCALSWAMHDGERLAAWGWTIGALTPALSVACVVQVLLRASNFGTVRPAREALFTVVERDVKYTSKSFVDTFVYRFGDAAGGWTFHGLRALALSLPSIALATIPLAGVWIVVGRGLVRRQHDLTEDRDARAAASASAPPS